MDNLIVNVLYLIGITIITSLQAEGKTVQPLFLLNTIRMVFL